jgi:hypothetical protein
LANSGVSKLAQVIASRIASQTQRPDALELGTIQGDMSLKLDRFAVPIPKGDYLIAEWLVKVSLPVFSLLGTETSPVDEQGVPQPGATTTPLTKYEFREFEVDQVKLEFKPDLKPGDRVLVAWVLDGTEPIILSKVVSS